MFGTLAKPWNSSFHDAPPFSWLNVGVERSSGQRLWDNIIAQTELQKITYIDKMYVIFFKTSFKRVTLYFRMPILKTKEMHVHLPMDKTIQSSSVLLFISGKNMHYLEKILYPNLF